MPAKWQKWIPLDIDQFWSSPSVQRMSDSGKIGYLALICAQWQSEDGALPSDMDELAIASRLTDDAWQAVSASILRKFTPIQGNRIRNEACFQKWVDSKKVFEVRQEEYAQLQAARSEAGKIGAQKRWQKDGKAIAKPWQKDGKPMAKDSFTYTVTVTKTEKQKPSGKPGAESRHQAFHEQVDRYWKHKTGEEKALWDGSEGKALSALLAAKPDLTIEQFRVCLKHRGDSPDELQTERPRQWLPNILRFAGGPLDRYGKPLQASKPALPQLRSVTLEEAMQR
jgi:uncharacterized protein YdaU (DUF1376 family)